MCQQLQVTDEGTTRLIQREAELEALLERVDPLLGRDSCVRMEDGALVVTPLEAEERPESAEVLDRLIDERLPRVELSELLVEVDGWTGFSGYFEHAGGREPRSPDPPPLCLDPGPGVQHRPDPDGPDLRSHL